MAFQYDRESIKHSNAGARSAIDEGVTGAAGTVPLPRAGAAGRKARPAELPAKHRRESVLPASQPRTMGKNLFIHGQVGTAGRVNGFLCQDHDVFDGSQHVLRDHQRGPDAHVLGGDPCDIRVCGETGDASDSGSTNSLRTAETPIPDSKSENLKKPQISGVYRCSAHFNNSSGSLDSEQSPNGESSQVNPHCSLRREPTPSAADALSFLHANVRSYRYKVAELTRIVERSNFPTYVAFTETWLDKSFESIKLPGYVEVSRRDRGTSAHGGVILFAKAGFENTIVHLGNSAVAERSWHVVHSNCGPLLLGVWYRRPCHAEVVSIESLDREIQEYGRDTWAEREAPGRIP